MPSGLRLYNAQILCDAVGQPVGMMGADGREYLFGTSANSAAAVALTPFNPASVAITGGTINNTSLGVTTPAVVKASDVQRNRTDISGTPGNGTVNTPRGRAAFAAAATAVVVTSSLVTAASTVLVQVGGADATLLMARVTCAAGSFTVTGNAAATAVTPFDFIVVN